MLVSGKFQAKLVSILSCPDEFPQNHILANKRFRKAYMIFRELWSKVDIWMRRYFVVKIVLFRKRMPSKAHSCKNDKYHRFCKACLFFLFCLEQLMCQIKVFAKLQEKVLLRAFTRKKKYILKKRWLMRRRFWFKIHANWMTRFEGGYQN